MTKAFFARANIAEQRLCRFANLACRRSAIRALFRAVSRLGDGASWYALIVLMPILAGTGNVRSGIIASLHMLFAGACGLSIYKILKKTLVRERPFIALIGIECAMPPLDRYSFPSGHTLHAVLFTIIAVGYCPSLIIVLAPFALLIALSRIVLGLHYPSDVVVGAALGWAISKLSWVVRDAIFGSIV